MVQTADKLNPENHDSLSSEVLMVIEALVIAFGLSLPIFGLAVLLLDFTVMFLPVFVAVGLAIGIAKAWHSHKKRTRNV